ncbi:MAG: hypothetical protein KJN72_05850 [Woeseia sp.]|nr:hypothetical protein [Woeseia sp.]
MQKLKLWRNSINCQCKSQKLLRGVEGREYAKSHLQQITVDDTAWAILHKCPNSEVFWRESFPQSEMHGGGPSVLERITREEATQEFHI